jgi:hydrogenase expression/formation protein HypC
MHKLPLDARQNVDLSAYEAPVCGVDEDGCLTCGDVAVAVTVVEPGMPDALCVDDHGNEGRIAVELVGEVIKGDRLLVHAGVAIERLADGGERS